jgi:hypothetical protein
MSEICNRKWVESFGKGPEAVCIIMAKKAISIKIIYPLPHIPYLFIRQCIFPKSYFFLPFSCLWLYLIQWRDIVFQVFSMTYSKECTILALSLLFLMVHQTLRIEYVVLWAFTSTVPYAWH